MRSADSIEDQTADSHAAPHALSARGVVARLNSDREKGLSEAEARARLAAFGRNELASAAPDPRWKKFLAQFKSALVILLLAGAAISALAWLLERDAAMPYEAIAIVAVVLLNAVLGFVQESRAEYAVAALRQLSAARARVLREGQSQSRPAAEIVPGDIIFLEQGDTVPADARVIHSAAMQTAEASLTGESLPTAKDAAPLPEDAALGDRTNMLFAGTAVTSGRGQAVVTGTGMQTEIGRIAEMLKETPVETTPLQAELDRTGKRLGLIVISIAMVMIATIILVEKVRGLSALVDVLILGVALAVAAVPEGLPAVVTAVLALGVQRMAKRNAIVRHLAAVETLGSASVIASDKTGTLTKNEMTVRSVIAASGRIDFTGVGYAPDGDMRVAGGAPLDEPLQAELRRILTAGHRANNASLRRQAGRWVVQGDPTEGALLVAARKAGLDAEALEARFSRIGEIPFSSERKLMSTVHSDAEQKERLIVFTKGAPDLLVSRCSLELLGESKRLMTDRRRLEIHRCMEALAGQGLRMLALAAKEVPGDALGNTEPNDALEQELIFLGLIGMLDPPREEARQSVARAQAAGIRPVMITGDHPGTAAAIAAELGIAGGERAMTGGEVEQLSPDALAKAVQDFSVFARVNPEHKLRIVKALQSGGAIVAMTGDGVNDAPALKRADIGIAMGLAGTDVSREAADLVLTDDNFATIVAAVEEGRAIFSNIRKFLRYLLSSNIGEVLTMFFGVLLARFIGLHADGEIAFPLTATQILWINLVTDGAPALALGLDPPDPGQMNRPPRRREEGVITRRMWAGIFLVGAIMAAGALLVLDASLPGGLIPGTGSLRYAQTMTFTTLVLFQMFNVFNARSDTRSAFRGALRNRWLWGATGLSLGLQAAVVYCPFLQNAFSTVSLGAWDWLVCVAAASSVLWLREASKLLARRAGDDRGSRG